MASHYAPTGTATGEYHMTTDDALTETETETETETATGQREDDNT
jgi:hypothetical protein